MTWALDTLKILISKLSFLCVQYATRKTTGRETWAELLDLELDNGPTREEFFEVLRAIQGLTHVVDQQVHLQQNDLQLLINEQVAQNRTTFNSVTDFWNLNPPKFDGHPDPMVAKHWLIQIEKMFYVLNLTDEKKVPLVAFVLVGKAEH